jgi:hypothetical protein
MQGWYSALKQNSVDGMIMGVMKENVCLVCFSMLYPEGREESDYELVNVTS